ncbi:MAG: hypothetical protein E6K10_02495 [Methanobacteriota archaeon]|nr:MAG: hypothetical protein E6K10_02495 [Euryarchaeota archaeon]
MDPGRWSNRKRAAVVLLAIALILASGWFAWELLRPRTIREVMQTDPWAAGATVDLEGEITGISRVNTSLGREVYLELDHYSTCGPIVPGAAWDVRADPNGTYRIGDRFRTTVHFVAHTFNGDPAVVAPELPCPFPVLPWAIGAVWDTVSAVAGFALLYRETDTNGWARYEVLTTSGDSYRPAVLPLTLRRSPAVLAQDPGLRARGSINSASAWEGAMALQYLLVSGNFRNAPIVDEMASLLDGTSRNGTVRYADADGNGWLDDGDWIDLRPSDPGTPTAYDTYMVQVGEAGGQMVAYAYGGAYALNGRGGPRDLPADSFVTSGLVHLRHVGDQIAAKVASTLEVTRVRWGVPQPLSELTFRLSVNQTFPEATGNLVDLPITLPSGVSLSFADSGAAGLFDAGDRFLVANLDNRTPVVLTVSGAQATLGEARWFAGYGHIIGRLPQLTLTATGSGPYLIDTGVPFWHPELEMNRTPRAALRENGITVLRDRPLVNGTIGTFANGSVTFVDADGDGFLSQGDAFVVQGAPAARYELEVSVVFGTVSQRVTFGA